MSKGMNRGELETLGKVVSRYWEDTDFQKELLANPREVLVEAGFTIREGVSVTVKEGETGLPYRVSDTEVVLPLPPKPDDLSVFEEGQQELSDEDLKKVAGGAGFPSLQSRHLKIGNWMNLNNVFKDFDQPCAW